MYFEKADEFEEVLEFLQKTVDTHKLNLVRIPMDFKAGIQFLYDEMDKRCVFM